MPSRTFIALSLWSFASTSPVNAASGNDGPGSDRPIDIDSIIGENNLEDVEVVRGTTYYEMAKSVARLENFSRDGFCTGIRVGETLFLTNYHCWEAGGCRVRFRMGFERRLPDVEQGLFECTSVIQKAEDLDFVLYRVRPLYDQLPNYPVAALSTAPLAIDQALIAPGHPILQRKQIDTSSGCKVTRAEPYVHEGVISMQHQCDTQAGSSGSPLIDRGTGHVVGLHWGSEGGTGANHGVPMSLILDRIQEMDPLLYTELTIVED